MLMERGALLGTAITLSVDLDEGYAERMGDGLFMLFQEVDGKVDRVLVSADDMRRLLRHTG